MLVSPAMGRDRTEAVCLQCGHTEVESDEHYFERVGRPPVVEIGPLKRGRSKKKKVLE